MRTCNSSSEIDAGVAGEPFFPAGSDAARRRVLTNEVTRFGLNAVIFDLRRERLIEEFLPWRLSTRLVDAGFAGDRSALLRFDCLAKGYAVKVSGDVRHCLG